VILQEEVAEMDKDVAMPILAVVIVAVEEEAEVVDTMTLVTTTRTMRIITSKTCRNEELQTLAKEPISKMLHQNTIIWM
jgi:hypothetical protein